MRTIPVIYGSNPEKLFYASDEFGEIAAILADTFEEAYEEALCLLYARDGECDHGVPEHTIGLHEERGRAAESCDCSWSDDGPVWAVHLTLRPTPLTLNSFELVFGEDVKEIQT